MDGNVIGISAIIFTMLSVGVVLWRSIRGATGSLHGRIDKLDARVDALDEKLTARIDGKVDQLDKKFDAKIDKLGDDLRTEIAAVRTEVAGEVASVRTELIARIDRVHEDLVDTRVHLSDRVSRLEGAVLGHLTPHPARESAG